MPGLRALPVALALCLMASAPALAAPTVQIVSPGAYSAEADLAVTAAVDASAACGRVVATNGSFSRTAEMTLAGGTLSAVIPGFPEGRANLNVRAWDAAGCVDRLPFDAGSQSGAAIVDRSAPEPFAIAQSRSDCPAPGSDGVLRVNTTDPLVCWRTARDEYSEVAGFRVSVDGVEILGLGLSSSSTRAQLRGVAQGLHRISVVAIDSLGHERAATGADQLLVDTSAPTLRWSQPGQKTMWVRRRVALLVAASDPGGAGLERIIFSRRPPAAGAMPNGDLGIVSNPSLPAASQRLFFDTTKLRDGRYDWTATAVDRVGNLRSVKKTVRVDNTSPVFRRSSGTRAVVGRGARRLLIKVSDAASPQVRTAILIRRGSKTVYRGGFRLARDTDVQKITIPAKVASGNYRMVVSVKDLAGNLATKIFPLSVRR